MPVLKDRLDSRGWRITPQRRAVVTALTGDHLHLRAEEVHARARTVVPEVSLATVYNTLNELVAMGEVAEVRVGSGPARYDPNVEADHHHLVCQGCGLIFDVDPAGVAGLRLPTNQRHGFAVAGVEVVFRGNCPTCSAGL